MADSKDKKLKVLEAELHFLRRHVQNIPTVDFDAIDEAEMAIASALRTLEEYVLSLQPEHEDVPAGVPLAAEN